MSSRRGRPFPAAPPSRTASTVLALTALWLLTGAPVLAPPAHAQTPRFDVHERVLDNGVTVLVLERPNHAGRVAARVFYRSDMAGERPGTIGLTHMLEHHLFKGSHFLGTTDWDAEREVAERVERTAREMEDEKNRLQECFRQREVFSELERECRASRLDSLTARYRAAVAEQDRYTVSQPDRTAYMAAGATGLTASTGRDWMKFHADLPAHRLEAFMWIERSRMENPVFRQFDPEKQVVIEQIRRAFNREDAAFNRALRSLTYEASPYGWAHWFSDLEGATREDHWEIYHRFFTPQNTILVVVGDVRAPDVFAMAERYWGDWPPARPAPRLRTVEPVPAGQRRLTARAGAGPAFALNVPVPAVGHPDQAALEVLAELLGGRTGLLMRRLGDELGLVTGASASTWTSKFPSHFGLHVPVRRNDDLARVEEEVGRVLEEIARGDVPPELVAAAVRSLTFRYVAGFEDPGDAAVTIGSYAAIHDWRHVNALPELWGAVTPAELAQVTARYFAPDLRVVGVLHRTEDGEARTSQEEGGYDPARQARPGSWPAGGPVEELAQPLPERMPEPLGPAVGRRAEERLPPALPDAQGRFEAWGRLADPRPGEPLPVAESVWYVPPWMAVRRGILDDRPTTRPRTLAEIRYPEAPYFRPPRAEEHAVEAPAGLEAFFVEDRFLPLVQASLLVDLSPLDDPAGKEGLARLALEVLLESGAGERTIAELRARLDALGVTLSSDADDRRARLDLLAPAESAGEALVLLGQLAASPRLDRDAFRRVQEREAIRASRTDDEPTPTLDRIFARAAYGEDHPLARFPTLASIRAVTYEDVERTVGDALTGARLGLAVSGGASPEDVRRWVSEGFQALRPGRPPSRSAIPPPAGSGPALVTADRRSAQGFVKMGYASFRGIPEDHAAFELVSYVLVGAGQGGHLFQLLRTELGVTAAVYGEADPRMDGPATYEIRFAGNPPTLAEAIRQTCRRVDRIRRDGLTAEELERAKVAYMEGHVPSMYRTPHRVALRFAEKAVMERYDYVRTNYLSYYAGDEEQVEAVRRVGLPEASAAARRYLRPRDMVVAVVGPLEEIRAGAPGLSGDLTTCEAVID